MRDPNLALALQKGIRAAILAYGNLADALNDQGYRERVFDRVPGLPEKIPFPYITIGEDDVAGDGSTCVEGVEVTSPIHVWSRKPGRTEAKTIGGWLINVLGRPIEIEGNRTISGEFVTAVYRAGRDDLETEGVIVFRYLVDPYS